MRHICPISGKDSAATALLLRQAYPTRAFEFFFNATGTDLPETLDWLARVSRHLGAPIHYIGADLVDIIVGFGILPAVRERFCTRLAKIHPMEDWIGDDEAVVYFGIRADEDRAGYSNDEKPNIHPSYPLVEWGVVFEHVWALLEETDLLPPAFHWAWMEREVRRLLGRSAPMLDAVPVPVRRQLLAWRTRTNCFHCFFQRYYEWVGLKEHHPDLFARALELEETTGAEGFGWNSNGKSLRQIQAEAGRIKAKRARDVARAVSAASQAGLFEDTSLPVIGACGLFCSK